MLQVRSEVVLPEVHNVSKEVHHHDRHAKWNEDTDVEDFLHGVLCLAHGFEFVNDAKNPGKRTEGNRHTNENSKENHHKGDILDLHNKIVDHDKSRMTILYDHGQWSKGDLNCVDRWHSTQE